MKLTRRQLMQLSTLAAYKGIARQMLADSRRAQMAATSVIGMPAFIRETGSGIAIVEKVEQNQNRSGKFDMSLREFFTEAWHVVEPSTPFVGGYHVDIIAEHLEAISNGQLHNAIFNFPPRHTKSTFVGVMWPAWEWTRDPWLQWFLASYREALATRDSVKCRRLIQSGWYQERWGDKFKMTTDQNEKRRYENNWGGYRSSMGTNTGTGDGGHRLVLDDPMSAKQAESDTERETINDWVDSTFSTRANDPKTSARVVVMQRLHPSDTTGHLLKKAAEGGTKFDHIVLPAEYEPTVQVCVSDLKLVHDPRTVPGEPLAPERFGKEELEQLKVDLGSDDRVAGQLQQRPSAPGGSIFKREWWDGKNRYDWNDQKFAVHEVVFRYASIDTAFKDGQNNDNTAILIGELLADYRLAIREITMEKVQFHDLIDFIVTTCGRWNFDGKLEAVIIEDKGSGTSALQQIGSATEHEWLAAKLRGFMPPGSKEYRARKAAIWPARDMVLLPEPCPEVPWLLPFAGPEPQGNLFKFPVVDHDDDVDTFTQLIDYLWEVLAAGWRARRAALGTITSDEDEIGEAA
jgi:phage terminase large subunit-like protein